MDKTKTKKNVPLMCVAVVLSVALCVALAVGLSTRTCAVTFRQEGQPDIVRIVPRGGRLKDVPEIEQVPGYTTVWNVDDFSCVKEDLLVETVTSPNQYTIFYDTGKEEAVIETTTQEVTYGTSYTLARPTCEGYTFGNWVIQYSTTEVRDGVYEFTSDLPLSAVWIPHEFTITYETGKPEAQIAQEKQQALYGEPCVLETPVCEGFAFTGWQIKGTETILENGDPYPIVGDITLVAQWEPDGASGYWLTDFESSGGAWNLYTVTFRQEGRKDIVRTVYQGGAVKDVPKVTPVPGYNVMWSVKDLSKITSDLVVVAVKIPCKYTITYDTVYAQAQIARTQQQAIYGDACPLETPTCEGYTFKGWRIQGTDTMMASGARYTRTGSVTLEAVWEKKVDSSYWITDFESDGSADPNTYTVTFRQEGKQDIVRTVTEGQALKNVPKVAPVPGYSVMWSVKDFGNITSDLLVVAVKTPGKYTITYETGHAEAEIARTQQQVTYGEAYTLETAKCEGFRFKGWKIKGTQTMFASSGQYRQTGSITLEAVWDKDVTSQLWITDFEFDPNARNTYTVTFRQTGYPDVTRTVTEGEALTDIPDPKPVEGYTVIWSVGDFSSVSRDLTVTAVQLLGKYTITYETGHANAQISQTQQRVTYGEAYTLATPECEGYTFQNWKIKDTGEIFESGDAYRRGSDVTLTAVWKPNEYTITYDPVNNRAEMAQKLQTVRFGEAYTLLRPTCDGYTFKQWQIKETGEAFDSGSGYPYAGNITLVARWEKDPNSSYWLTDFEADDSLVGKKYTITYDKVYAHAKLEQKELRVATGEAYTLATPECDGYTFKGWKLEGTETVFTDGDEYPYSYGITLVAVWEKKPTSSYWITDFEYDVQ